MIKIWVNHYGWVMMGRPEKGLRFTQNKAGAKPFQATLLDKENRRSELFAICKHIEMTMQCNYDLVKC